MIGASKDLFINFQNGKKCFLPRLWMDVFDWSEVMCLALSTVSQSTASCFLASASSPYTQGLAHLASARKQDLD